MRSIVLDTEAAALAACALVDAHMGYPREELDQKGRTVVTSRWTRPVELADGTWAVQVPDDVGESQLEQEPLERDLAALRRVDVFEP